MSTCKSKLTRLQPASRATCERNTKCLHNATSQPIKKCSVHIRNLRSSGLVPRPKIINTSWKNYAHRCLLLPYDTALHSGYLLPPCLIGYFSSVSSSIRSTLPTLVNCTTTSAHALSQPDLSFSAYQSFREFRLITFTSSNREGRCEILSYIATTSVSCHAVSSRARCQI